MTRYSDGRSSSHQVERPRVSIDEWMNALQPGDAWLRVAPIDLGWRQERVRVALPKVVEASEPERAIVRVEGRRVVESPGDTKGTAPSAPEGTYGGCAAAAVPF